jgi:hypothetical protein
VNEKHELFGSDTEIARNRRLKQRKSVQTKSQSHATPFSTQNVLSNKRRWRVCRTKKVIRKTGETSNRRCLKMSELRLNEIPRIYEHRASEKPGDGP